MHSFHFTPFIYRQLEKIYNLLFYNRISAMVSGESSPKKIALRLGLGFGLESGLVLGLGGNFP